IGEADPGRIGRQAAGQVPGDLVARADLAPRRVGPGPLAQEEERDAEERQARRGKEEKEPRLTSPAGRMGLPAKPLHGAPSPPASPPPPGGRPEPKAACPRAAGCSRISASACAISVTGLVSPAFSPNRKF